MSENNPNKSLLFNLQKSYGIAFISHVQNSDTYATF